MRRLQGLGQGPLTGPKPLTFAERLAKIEVKDKAKQQASSDKHYKQAANTGDNKAEPSKDQEAQEQRDEDNPKASLSERASLPTATTQKMVPSSGTRSIATEKRPHKHESFTGSIEVVEVLRKDVYMEELSNEAFWLDVSVEELVDRKNQAQMTTKAELSTAGQKRKFSDELEDIVKQQDEEEDSWRRVTVDLFFDNTEYSAPYNKSQQDMSKKGKECVVSVRKDESNVTEPPKKRQKIVGDSNAENYNTKETVAVNKNSIDEGSSGADHEGKKQERKDELTCQKKRERETGNEDEHIRFSPPKKKSCNILRQAREGAEENRKEEEKSRRPEEQKEIFQRRWQSRNQETRYREGAGTGTVDVQCDVD